MAITNQEIVKAIKAGGVVTSLGELAAGDAITLKGDGSSETGQITLNNAGNTAGTVLKSGAVSSSVTFTLPTADGSTGQVLSTNGSGALSFSDDSGISLAAARGGISVTTSSASGGGTLGYTSSTGVLAFAPADLSTFITASSTDTLTNKTLTTPSLTAPTATATGSIVFKEGTDNGTNTITLQGGDNLGGSYVVTLPTTKSTNLIGNDTTDTLTNKTLTAPVITSVTSGGNAITFPNSTAQTLAGLAEDQTFLAANRGSVTANGANLTFDLATTNNFTASHATGTGTITFSNAASAVGQSGNIILTTTGGTVAAHANTKIANGTAPDGGLGTINAAAGVYWLSYICISSSAIYVVASAKLAN